MLSLGSAEAKSQWFQDKDLTLTGAYYYPEHWDESQWERDLKRMHELGFEFTHFGEFARARVSTTLHGSTVPWRSRRSTE